MNDHLSRRSIKPAGDRTNPVISCDLPGSRRAGSTILFGLAPDGVYLAAASPQRRCALTAPFHLCLIATHVWSRHRPCISVALSCGFPRVGVTHRPCPVVSGLSSKGFLSPRSRPTHAEHHTAPDFTYSSICRSESCLPAGNGPLLRARESSAMGPLARDRCTRHLDRIAGPVEPCSNQPEATRARGPMASPQGTSPDSSRPVSYTHLDVYKRQLLPSFAIAPAWMARLPRISAVTSPALPR